MYILSTKLFGSFSRLTRKNRLSVNTANKWKKLHRNIRNIEPNALF